MITDPVDIGVECDDQVSKAIIERAFLGEEKEVKAPQPFRNLFGIDWSVQSGNIRLESRSASATSQLQMVEATESGDNTKTIVSAARISPPSRFCHSSPGAISSRSR